MDLFDHAIPLILFFIAVVTFFVTNKNARNASKKAKKAIEVAEKAVDVANNANKISLSRMRSAPLVDIKNFESTIDLSNTEVFSKNLSVMITIKNKGEIAFENIHLELIGITPNTYKKEDVNSLVRPLPSITHNMKLGVMIHPYYFANIDLRLPLITYLEKLSSQLKFEDTLYQTQVNFVLLPTAVGDPLPSGVDSPGCKDRQLIIVLFKPSDYTNEKVKLYRENENNLTHRVYAYSS
jgi:hypothetical protein